jgi:hypothetical protein
VVLLEMQTYNRSEYSEVVWSDVALGDALMDGLSAR